MPLPMPPTSLELRIVINAEGFVTVHGPIDNKLLAFGMLELAKEQIQEHNRTKIQVPPEALGRLSTT